jgi:hypothetical protein
MLLFILLITIIILCDHFIIVISIHDYNSIIELFMVGWSNTPDNGQYLI